MPNQTHKAFLNVHLAALLLGGTALFPKLIPFDAEQIILLRTFIAAFALFLLGAWFKDLKVQKKDLGWLFVAGLFMMIHWVTYFTSLQITSTAIAVISLFTYPIFTVLIEPWFYKKPIAPKDLLSALMVLLGIYLLVPEFSLSNQTSLGIALGVISAFFMAMRNILTGKYLSHMSGLNAMHWQAWIIGFLLLPFITIPTSQIAIDWFYVVLLGLVFTATPHVLLVNGLRVLKAKTTGLIGCMQPLYAALFALIILNEKPGWNVVIGGSLIVITVIFEMRATNKKPA